MMTESGADSEPKQQNEKGGKAVEHFPADAGHSTPARNNQFEDFSSTRSSTSRLSIKSPLRGVKKLKNMQCKITLLDGSDYTTTVDKQARGQLLFAKVCDHLNLLETDYFGMTYRDMENQKTDSEQTDFDLDGETTASESEAEDDYSEKKTQDTEELEEKVKHQRDVNEMKHYFLDTPGGADTPGLKRLSSSSLARSHSGGGVEEAPMIEPLHTRQDSSETEEIPAAEEEMQQEVQANAIESSAGEEEETGRSQEAPETAPTTMNGGISETRIEKRIVISREAGDFDHDQE